MGNRFAKLNYYEMLDIQPDATLFEIRHAYNTVMQMYQKESLATYSFFSQEERTEIITLIDKAFLTLANTTARQGYDEELIRQGIIKAKDNAAPVIKKPVCIFDINRGQQTQSSGKNKEQLKARIAQSPRIGSILQQQEIKGTDLKAIRNEAEVLIEHISQETKIRVDHLKSIEEDDLERLPAAVFLKGFVKSYLKYLCIEPLEDISARYMNTIAGMGGKR